MKHETNVTAAKLPRELARELCASLRKQNSEIVANLHYWTKDGGNCIDEMFSSLEMDLKQYGENYSMIFELEKYIKS